MAQRGRLESLNDKVPLASIQILVLFTNGLEFNIQDDFRFLLITWKRVVTKLLKQVFTFEWSESLFYTHNFTFDRTIFEVRVGHPW